jgi:hypothetical protein
MKWFIVLNVALKIRMTQEYVLNVGHLYTLLGGNASITEGMKQNVSELKIFLERAQLLDLFLDS